MPGAKLTPRHQRFAEEFLLDWNAAAAARRVGISERRARQTASEWMDRADIQAEIARLVAALSARTAIDADAVLQRWWLIATADPNELMEYRRVCCRYCYGENHRYQRTPREVEEAMRDAQKREQAFDPLGGVGYDRRKPPAADCPECHGEGKERAFPKDTRALSHQARALFAGVKETKDGLELKTQDQGAALANVARHLGMFKERVELTGKDGGPIEVDVAATRARVAERLAKLAAARAG